MKVYKAIDQFDRNTGKQIESRRVVDYYICDFTGKKFDMYGEPMIYSINYQDYDPCFGDGAGEGWIYKTKWRNSTWELFSDTDYVFLTGEDGTEIFPLLIQAYNEQSDRELVSLDQLLRWGRAQMLKKKFEEGKDMTQYMANPSEVWFDEEYED